MEDGEPKDPETIRTYQRRTRVEAPLSSVWAFYSDITGLTALTPDWFHLQVDTIQRPESTDSEELVPGTTISLSMRPFGILPRQRWVSRIVAREEGDGWAYFRDVMDEGPFPFWEHTHQFFGDGAETVIVDRVRYAPPFEPLENLLAPVMPIGFELMFRYRQQRTKEILE